MPRAVQVRHAQQQEGSSPCPGPSAPAELGASSAARLSLARGARNQTRCQGRFPSWVGQSRRRENQDLEHVLPKLARSPCPCALSLSHLWDLPHRPIAPPAPAGRGSPGHTGAEPQVAQAGGEAKASLLPRASTGERHSPRSLSASTATLCTSTVPEHLTCRQTRLQLGQGAWAAGETAPPRRGSLARRIKVKQGG